MEYISSMGWVGLGYENWTHVHVWGKHLLGGVDKLLALEFVCFSFVCWIKLITLSF